MFDQRFRKKLEQQRLTGLIRNPGLIDEKNGRFIRMDGRNILNFASNDYLGLAADSSVKSMVARNFAAYGPSASSSRLVTGNHRIIREAELKYAEYFGYEDALFLPSGFQANIAVISTLFSKEDEVFFDKHIHASSVKGITLSGASFYGYRHNDTTHLERRLSSKTGNTKGLVTEALFSMDGDTLDLKGLLGQKEKHNLLCVVDEAHSFGVLGEKGRGIGRPLADVAVGTFGKAFGLFGAFVLLPSLYRDYMVNFATPLIYSTCLPEAHAASTMAILEKIEKSDDRREYLRELRNLFVRKALEKGLKVNGDAHILSLFVGSEQKSLTLSRRLFERGICVFPARFPTVPLGRAMIRISLTTLLEKEDVIRLIHEISAIRME
jgi:8-amino-7-oxononanoate synthase